MSSGKGEKREEENQNCDLRASAPRSLNILIRNIFRSESLVLKIIKIIHFDE